MKVLLAHNLYRSGQPSGENAVVAAEIDELARAGADVIALLRSSDDLPLDPTLPQRAALAMSATYAPAAQRELHALLRRHRPDVLHLHNPYPLLSPWVVRTAHSQGVPVVHTLHNFRQTCVNGLHFRDDSPCHDCLGHRLPLPAVRHGCYRGSRAQSAAMAAALVAHRGTWPTVDRVLAPSPVMADYAATLGIPRQRVVVRPNAVPDPGRHGIDGEGFLFAGRLSAEKGVGLLLDAWQRHPDGALGRLRVAGDGPLAGLVRDRASARRDLDYLGRLEPDDLVDEVRRAAAVVMPSTWDEPLGLVAIEALANARPVLATARGALPWVVGGAGWVVDPTVEALAAALPQAEITAPALRATARAAYEARFTPQVATAALLEIYRSLQSAQT